MYSFKGYEGLCIFGIGTNSKFVAHDAGLWTYDDEKHMYFHLLSKICGIDTLKSWEIEKQIMFDELSKTLRDCDIDFVFENETFEVKGISLALQLGCGSIWRNRNTRQNFKHYELVNNKNFFTDIKEQIEDKRINHVEKCKLQQIIDAEKEGKQINYVEKCKPYGQQIFQEALKLTQENDIPESLQIDPQIVKQFTGGDMITARPLFISDHKNVNGESVSHSNIETDETPKLSKSSVKFCGQKIENETPVSAPIKMPCYGPIVNTITGVPSVDVEDQKRTTNDLRLGDMERTADRGYGILLKEKFVPPSIPRQGITPPLKQRTKNDTPFTINLQELLQVKDRLKKTKPVEDVKLIERDAIESLLKSCHKVQIIEKVSKPVCAPEKVVNVETHKIPTKQSYPNLACQEFLNTNNPDSDLRCVDMNMTIIKGSDFSKSDMRYAKMRGMKVKNTNLSGVDFTGTDLKHSIFKNVDFTGAKLCNLNCDCVEFKNCIFEDANIKYSSFVGANLQGSKLGGIDLTGCCFKNANLIDTEITADVASLYPIQNFDGAYIGFQKVYIF